MTEGRGAYREPLFNAPWPATALVGALCAAFAAQTFLLNDAQLFFLALSPEAFRSGYWYELFTHQFLHGGLMHLIMNSVGAFAFAAPVIRLFGLRNRDVALFYIYFLVCGAIGGLGWLAYAELAGAGGIVIGASGAVSGLWGGASRLLGRRGGLAPFTDRTVLSQALAFAGINVVVGLLSPLIGLNIGWQAHIAGYAAGLLLIGLFGHMAGRLRAPSRPRDLQD
jgi:membrane associated rhomboid family serine protease